MSTEALRDFSESLKKTREKSKVTLQQIHNHTRIDIQYLRAIEEANFSIMPEVYMKAFLKEYAQSIGLDPADTIEKFEFAKTGKPKNTIHSETQLNDQTPYEQKPKEDLKEFAENTASNSERPAAPQKNDPQKNKIDSDLLMKIGYGAGVVIIVLLVYFVFFDNSPDEIIIESPYEEVLKENNNRYEEETPPQGKPSKPAAIDSLMLSISAIDTVWIRIDIDNNVTKEYILYPNRNKSLKAAEFFLVYVGNAGGVKLALNGADLEFNGRAGQVRKFRIDQNGITYLKTKKPSSNEQPNQTEN